MKRKRLAPEGHIVHEGQKGVYERTDPEYYDKHLARLLADIKACPAEWMDTLLSGIDERDWKAMKERGFIKDLTRPNK